MELERILAEYAAEMAPGEELVFDEGICHLEIGGHDIGFMTIPERETILVWTAVMNSPTEDVAAFYRLLLRANFMGQGVRDGAFSLSDENVVFAHRTFLAPGTKPADFAAAVSAFVDDVEVWRQTAERAHAAQGVMRRIADELDEPPRDGLAIRV